MIGVPAHARTYFVFQEILRRSTDRELQEGEGIEGEIGIDSVLGDISR